jgi:hypothetical protein
MTTWKTKASAAGTKGARVQHEWLFPPGSRGKKYLPGSKGCTLIRQYKGNTLVVRVCGCDDDYKYRILSPKTTVAGGIALSNIKYASLTEAQFAFSGLSRRNQDRMQWTDYFVVAPAVAPPPPPTEESDVTVSVPLFSMFSHPSLSTSTEEKEETTTGDGEKKRKTKKNKKRNERHGSSETDNKEQRRKRIKKKKVETVGEVVLVEAAEDRLKPFRLFAEVLPKITNVEDQKSCLNMILDPAQFADRDVSLPDNREYEIVFRFLSKVHVELCRRKKSIAIPPMSDWPVDIIDTLTKNKE